MRNIRLRHNISLAELGRICGLSPQRISEIELNRAELSLETQRKLCTGLHRVADQRERELDLLRRDLKNQGTSLFKTEESNGMKSRGD